MKIPRIAVTPSATGGTIKTRQNYLDAIYAAGGIPIIVPYTDDESRIKMLADELDGIMFSGGVDLDPVHYGEEKQFDSVEICPERDSFELAIFKEFYKARKPIFGICRGIQLINVALGGTLYQHIDGHKQSESTAEWPREAVVEPGTRLAGISGGCRVLKINSFHHQAVKAPAPGAIVSARAADDGIVEAIELPEEVYPYLVAVQWHPEYFYDKEVPAGRLFGSFVDACKK